MDNPVNLKYTKEHQWVKVEGNIATVGITFFAQKKLKDIVFIELPEKGEQVEQDKKMAVVESVKSVSDVFAPVSGEVVEINEKLADAPDIINKDPYGAGWFAKIRVKGKADIGRLMSAEQYGNIAK